MMEEITRRYLAGEAITRLAAEYGVPYSTLRYRLVAIAPPARVRGQKEPISTMDRFMDKAMPEPTSGCWLWLSSAGKHGYGRFYWPPLKRHTTAQRASYFLFKGGIPRGLEVDHICKNPSCVNPDHLRAVTKAVNLAGRRNANGEKTHCKRGHPLAGGNLRVERYGGRRCRACVNHLRHVNSAIRHQKEMKDAV